VLNSLQTLSVWSTGTTAQQRNCASKPASATHSSQLITPNIPHRPTPGRRARSHPRGTTGRDAGDIHQRTRSRAWIVLTLAGLSPSSQAGLWGRRFSPQQWLWTSSPPDPARGYFGALWLTWLGTHSSIHGPLPQVPCPIQSLFRSLMPLSSLGLDND